MKRSYRGGDIGPLQTGLRQRRPPTEDEEMFALIQETARRAQARRARERGRRPGPGPEELHQNLISTLIILLSICAVIGLVYMFWYCGERECNVVDRIFLFAFPFLIAFTISIVSGFIGNILNQWKLGQFDPDHLVGPGIVSIIAIVLSYTHYNYYHS